MKLKRITTFLLTISLALFVGTAMAKGKSDKSDKSDKSGKSFKSGKSHKSGKSGKPGKGLGHCKSDKSDKSHKSHKKGRRGYGHGHIRDCGDPEPPVLVCTSSVLRSIDEILVPSDNENDPPSYQTTFIYYEGKVCSDDEWVALTNTEFENGGLRICDPLPPTEPAFPPARVDDEVAGEFYYPVDIRKGCVKE